MKLYLSEKRFLKSLKNTLSSLKLDGIIELLDYESEDALHVEVVGGTLIRCAALDFSQSIQPGEVPVGFVLQCCGLREIQLTGLVVKDQQGNKIRPTMRIFTQETSIPDTLEHIRHPSLGSRTETVKIHCSSSILTSLLDSGSLWFKNGNRFFEVFSTPDGCFIRFEPDEMHPGLDLLLGNTHLRDFTRHLKIAKNYPVFNSFLSGKTENLVFNKKFYSKIKSSTHDMYNLLDFIEHAPRFLDSRDRVIAELTDFVSEIALSRNIQKHEYLDVYKQRVPESRNRSCLKKLLGPPPKCPWM